MVYLELFHVCKILKLRLTSQGHTIQKLIFKHENKNKKTNSVE